MLDKMCYPYQIGNILTKEIKKEKNEENPNTLSV